MAIEKEELSTGIDTTLRITGTTPTKKLGLNLYSDAFADGDDRFVDEKITFEHGLGRFPLHVTVVDSFRTICVMPTRFVNADDEDSDNHVTLDFTGWGTLVGEYKILISP